METFFLSFFTKLVSITETMSKTLIPIDTEAHKKAKVLAAQKGITLKQLTTLLVSNGVKRVRSGEMKIEQDEEVSK